MIAFTQLLQCNGTALYQLTKQSPVFSTSGTLQLLIAYDGMLLLKLNDFEYGVNPKDQIVYDNNDPQFSIVFYLKKYPEGRWLLKVGEHADQVFSCMNQKCYLKCKQKVGYSRYGSDMMKKSNKGERVIQEKKKVHLKREDSSDEEEKKEKTQINAKSVLIGASKGIGKGLAFTGKWLSKGFESVGGLISKKVEPAEQKTELSEETRENIKLAKNTTKNVLNFTSQQVSNLFRFGKNMMSDIGERFQNSETGKQAQQNQYYENVKEGAKTGATVISNIYDGVVTAVYEVGSGIGKGASKVIGKKYGDEAGQAADDALQGTGNVVKILRVPQDQAAKTFKD